MKAITSLFAVVALAAAAAAVAQNSPMFAVVDGYARQITAAAASNTVAGPETFTLGRDQSEKPVAAPVTQPISALKGALEGCSITNRGYGYGRPGYPNWVQGRLNWECPTRGIADRAVLTVLTTSLDGRSIATVEMVVGGEVMRAGPRPIAAPKGIRNG
jgi:opacity protein-like surface antigen